MNISLSTASVYVYPLRWIFAIAQRAGFDGVELVISPEVEWRGGAYLRRLSQEYGLTIFSVHPPLFQYPGWRGSFANIVPFLPRALGVTQDVGAQILVIHMPKARNSTVGIGREFVQGIVAAKAGLNGAGTQIALENRAYFSPRSLGLILSTPQELRAFADEYDFPMTLDTAHAGSWGIGLPDAYPSFLGRLVNVHLSDLRDVPAHIEKRPRLHSYVKQHQLPGTGKLRLNEFLSLLVRDSYGGTVTLELSPSALHIWNPRSAEQKLKEAVDFVRKAIA